MTRHKRKKLRNFFRIAAVILPSAIILSKAADIKAVFRKMDSITLEKNWEIEEYTEPSTTETEIAEETTLNEELILSQGYGIYEEPDETENTETTSADAGAKPYPSESDWIKGGSIIRTTYGTFSGTTYFDLEKCGQVNNKTDIPNETLFEESKKSPDFTISDTSEPQVLIYHTHTTETFEPYVRDFCDAEFNYRTTDETKNMIMVGDAIQTELEEQGIGVVHARDIHDYPSYNGSYSRSRETVTKILEEYPEIKVVLDIHRDAIASDSGAYQPYVEIDGKEAAQIMIISCCDDGSMELPDYMQNFHFATSLQQQIESDYSGLTRPLLFDYRKYNQDLSVGSLLIEVGSHGNTLEQAEYSGQLIGKSLARLLNSMKEEE
jgi:stage II sporulation protein P